MAQSKLKCKIVLMDSSDSSEIVSHKNTNLHLRKHYGSAWEDMGDRYKHLYFTSSRKIKPENWYLYYMDENPELMQCRDQEEADRCNDMPTICWRSFKVEATTNRDLGIDLIDTECQYMMKYIRDNGDVEEVEIACVSALPEPTMAQDEKDKDYCMNSSRIDEEWSDYYNGCNLPITPDKQVIIVTK